MNLLGQNIGQNYRGILNLGTTINSPLSTTLQAVTDGMGNNSPLQLSTTQVAMLANTLFGASSATTNVLTLQSTTRNQLKVESGSTLEFWRSAATESARFDANGNFVISTTSASARLHVRGDGTNPIARLENSSGSAYFQVNSNGTATVLTGISTTGVEALRVLETGTITSTTGVYNGFNYAMLGSFRPPSGNPSFRPLSIAYELNASGANTGTATGIFLNATETALNGMGHNLIDLQRGGVSQFSVSRLGAATFASSISTSGNIALFNNWAIFSATSNGRLALYDSSGASFNLLQLGGTTNAFPAIKRNGAAIDFRLADDSAACDVNALSFRAMGSAHSIYYTSTGNGSEALINSTGVGPILRSAGGTNTWGQWGSDQIHLVGSGGAANRIGYNLVLQAGISTGNVNGGDIVFRGNPTNGVNGSSALNTIETLALIKNTGAFVLGTTSPNASAILQVDSTTRGFLPPRQSTTQRNAITSPAKGLIVFDSDINKLFVFSGATWEEITSV